MEIDVGRRVLLVEGISDREVIYQLCNLHGFDNRALLEVHDKAGIDGVLDDLSVRLKGDVVDVLGVVVDANADPDSRWARLASLLRRHSYQPPDSPPPRGLLLDGRPGYPSVGAWLMPDNKEPGAIEDFLLRLASSDDPLVPRARSVVDAIPEADRRFREAHSSKAVFHTWLAWQEEPGTPSGQAITRRYLDGDDPLARAFMAWLAALFDPPGATAGR